MAVYTLKFEDKINISLGIGDTVWYVDTNPLGGYSTAELANAKKLGKLISLEYNESTNATKIEVSDNTAIATPAINLSTAFFMFTKDNKVNLSSLNGYYAEARFINTETDKKAELFAVGSEIKQSSK